MGPAVLPTESGMRERKRRPGCAQGLGPEIQGPVLAPPHIEPILSPVSSSCLLLSSAAPASLLTHSPCDPNPDRLHDPALHRVTFTWLATAHGCLTSSAPPFLDWIPLDLFSAVPSPVLTLLLHGQPAQGCSFLLICLRLSATFSGPLSPRSHPSICHNCYIVS